jgi:outer membrane protein OmpA-like peptidoglycan-associated protein
LDNKALADIPRIVDALSRRDVHTGVKVLGFADSKGTPAQNQRVSEQRAEVVAKSLRAYGIQVESFGFGSAIPVQDNATAEGRDKNRRVEIWSR